MTVLLSELRMGDVVVVDAPAKGWASLGGWLIRLRSRLMGRPSLHEHICMFDHVDSEGIPRGYEGRPSGFGQVNMTKYLEDPKSISNAKQPKTDEQRLQLHTAAATMMGIPYDWAAIVAFALELVGLPFLARDWPAKGLPSQAVCSSGLAAAYGFAGLANPGGLGSAGNQRGVDVDDWVVFISEERWH